MNEGWPSGSQFHPPNDLYVSEAGASPMLAAPTTTESRDAGIFKSVDAELGTETLANFGPFQGLCASRQRP